MGNQREIRQVSPRQGLGVVIAVRDGRSSDVRRLLGTMEDQGRFYTYFCRRGEPVRLANLDFEPAIDLPPLGRDHIAIQSGGKMWCGYDAFVDHVRALAPYLDDALFFVGDEVEYIDEFHLQGGQLHYRRVLEGYWRPVDDYLRSVGLLQEE